MEQFDYIIVGAGSAGSVMAHRLSADPARSVLLVEGGGPDLHPLIHVPRGFGRILTNQRYTRLYKINKTGGYNAPEYWVRGSTLGGSSSVNGMVYVRGLPSDFDDWGCAGWRWPEILRAFREIEDHEAGESEWHGAGGPLKVTFHNGREPLLAAFLDAAEETGTRRVQDLNTVDDPAVGYFQRTIFRGRRQSAARAFLTPDVRSRKNLKIVTGAEVERLLLDGRRATGIEVDCNGAMIQYAARREIILAAGALGSPKLLQLAGIGPAAHLKQHGVEVLVDFPDVGGNLREHRLLLQQFEVSEGSQNFEFGGLRLCRNLLRYAFLRTGPLASAAFEAGDSYVLGNPADGRMRKLLWA